MEKYLCPCGYEYDPAVGDPDNGVAPGTAWENVPEEWVCPVCGLGKDAFEKAYTAAYFLGGSRSVGFLFFCAADCGYQCSGLFDTCF